MGGKGSGRPKREVELVRHLSSRTEPRTPIGTEIFLPNHSGDHDKGKRRGTPTDDYDLVNKKYVDDEIAAIPSLQIAGLTQTQLSSDGSTFLNAIGVNLSVESDSIYVGVLTFRFYSNGDNVDFKFSVPTSATMIGENNGIDFPWGSINEIDLTASNTCIIVAGAGTYFGTLPFVLETDSTAGTLQLQFKQNTLGPPLANINLKKGTSIRLHKVGDVAGP